MIIAHLPAGYLLTRAFLKRHAKPVSWRSRLLMLGLIASILPDFDLAYFYLIDHARHNHHSYWTHLPPYWLAAWGLARLIAKRIRFTRTTLLVDIFFANVILHFILDSFVGDIRWLAPFSDHYFSLTHVERRYDWWVWNFVLHWTFSVEIAITTVALVTAVRDRVWRKPAASWPPAA